MCHRRPDISTYLSRGMLSKLLQIVVILASIDRCQAAVMINDDKMTWIVEQQDHTGQADSSIGSGRVFRGGSMASAHECLCGSDAQHSTDRWCYLGESGNGEKEEHESVMIPGVERHIYCTYYVVVSKTYLYCNAYNNSEVCFVLSTWHEVDDTISNTTSSPSSSLSAECVSAALICSDRDCLLWCVKAVNVTAPSTTDFGVRNREIPHSSSGLSDTAVGLIVASVLFVAVVLSVIGCFLQMRQNKNHCHQFGKRFRHLHKHVGISHLIHAVHLKFSHHPKPEPKDVNIEDKDVKNNDKALHETINLAISQSTQTQDESVIQKQSEHHLSGKADNHTAQKKTDKISHPTSHTQDNLKPPNWIPTYEDYLYMCRYLGNKQTVDTSGDNVYNFTKLSDTNTAPEQQHHPHFIKNQHPSFHYGDTDHLHRAHSGTHLAERLQMKLQQLPDSPMRRPQQDFNQLYPNHHQQQDDLGARLAYLEYQYRHDKHVVSSNQTPNHYLHQDPNNLPTPDDGHFPGLYPPTTNTTNHTPTRHSTSHTHIPDAETSARQHEADLPQSNTFTNVRAFDHHSGAHHPHHHHNHVSLTGHRLYYPSDHLHDHHQHLLELDGDFHRGRHRSSSVSSDPNSLSRSESIESLTDTGISFTEATHRPVFNLDPIDAEEEEDETSSVDKSHENASCA